MGYPAGRRPRATDHRDRRRPQVDADPASVSDIELGLDTARSATIAPVWAALLTGNPEAQGHGTPSDEIRDASLTVIADQDGNKGVVCVDASAAKTD